MPGYGTPKRRSIISRCSAGALAGSSSRFSRSKARMVSDPASESSGYSMPRASAKPARVSVES